MLDRTSKTGTMTGSAAAAEVALTEAEAEIFSQARAIQRRFEAVIVSRLGLGWERAVVARRADRNGSTKLV